MQPPTCTGLRVRNVHDAQVILHSVSEGKLPMVHRRLDDDDRLALVPGNIYVWEERNCNPVEMSSLESIQRFTDGRAWGPSKAREYVICFVTRAITSCSMVDLAATSCYTTRRKARVEHLSYRGTTG